MTLFLCIIEQNMSNILHIWNERRWPSVRMQAAESGEFSIIKLACHGDRETLRFA